jgi:hypothetical protein
MSYASNWLYPDLEGMIMKLIPQAHLDVTPNGLHRYPPFFPLRIIAHACIVVASTSMVIIRNCQTRLQAIYTRGPNKILTLYNQLI